MHRAEARGLDETQKRGKHVEKQTISAALEWYLVRDLELGAGDRAKHGGGHDRLLTLGGHLPGLARGGACAGVYVYGVPGTGKTRTALALARGLCPEGLAPVVQPCHPGLTTGDAYGYYLPSDGGARWIDGFISRAWREGVPLVCDELGRALGSEAESALLTAFSGAGIAAVTLPTGETLAAPPGWVVLATGNTPADDLPEPLRERFVSLEVWGPSVGALEALTVGVPEVEGACLIRAVASHYRPASVSGGFSGGLAYRAAAQYRSLRADGADPALASGLTMTPEQSVEWLGAVGLATGTDGGF